MIHAEDELQLDSGPADGAAASEMIDLSVSSGLDLQLDHQNLSLAFGPGLAHPPVERRMLEDVRPMLWDRDADGPEHLYSVYMDICQSKDLPSLRAQGLLYGSMIYNHGVVGSERVRSQGHLHAVKPGTTLRYSEVFQFWTGEAYVYLQKESAPDVSRALLVRVGPGDTVVLPSGWGHLVSTIGNEVVSFGAWCARDNTFEYDQLKMLGGPAYFLRADGEVVRNPRYRSVAELEHVTPADVPDFGIPRGQPIYTSWKLQPSLFDFVSNPELGASMWARL